jgi:hypothetical protein
MAGLVPRDNRCIGGKREVNTRESNMSVSHSNMTDL